jgi:hypothetical protein
MRTVWHNKKFSEELIACFPLVQLGLHRKRHLQQLFVAAKTSYPSVTWQREGDTQTDLQTHASNNSYNVAFIHFRGNVFSEPFPSNDRRNTHADTQTDGRDLWSTPLRLTHVPWYMCIQSFIKISSGFQYLIGGIRRQRDTQILKYTDSMEIAVSYGN